jgi:hypothetical protein
MTNVTHMVCYRPSPEAELSREERAVLRTVKDARGLFLSRGLSCCDVMQRLSWNGAEAHATVQAIFESLERLGLVKKLTSGNYRRK